MLELFGNFVWAQAERSTGLGESSLPSLSFYTVNNLFDFWSIGRGLYVLRFSATRVSLGQRNWLYFKVLKVIVHILK